MDDIDYKLELMEPSFEAWSPSADKPRRVAMLMSGGVDSSVSAHLLRELGWDVVGFTMKVPVPCNISSGGCCGADAAFVCHELGLPHYFIDVTTVFEKLIIEPFRTDYAAGRTPNPCVDCNSLLKLRLVWDFIEKHFGIEYLATGHYACVYNSGGEYRLGRGEDKNKDQSYFLYGTPAGRLEHFLLPLSGYSKTEIRKIAAGIGISVAEKPESMELCFAGEGSYRDVLGVDESNKAGDLLDADGNVIGTHKGVSNYTIGQRRGLGYASSCPLYVIKIDAVNNTVMLGKKEDILKDVVRAGQVNVLIESELDPSVEMYGKIRSAGEPRACRFVEFVGGVISIRFDEPLFAPTPGQKMVLYNSKDEVIAGGTIY